MLTYSEALGSELAPVVRSVAQMSSSPRQGLRVPASPSFTPTTPKAWSGGREPPHWGKETSAPTGAELAWKTAEAPPGDISAATAGVAANARAAPIRHLRILETNRIDRLVC